MQRKTEERGGEVRVTLTSTLGDTGQELLTGSSLQYHDGLISSYLQVSNT